MGLLQLRSPAMTAEEFIEWENAQPDKHEFLGGEVFAMVGARRVHVAITLNVATLLKSHLRGGPCRAFMVDMKLAVRQADAIFYPDVMVTCHPGDLSADTVMEHPKVIVEVLSEGTAAYDRGEKFAQYRKLDSLEEYALIDPDRRTVEVFRRVGEGDWLLAASESGQGLILKSIGFQAAPDAVFEDAGA